MLNDIQFSDRDHGGIHTFAAKHGNEKVGHATVEAEGGHAILGEVYVRPDHREQGIGRQLVKNVTDKYADHKISLSPSPFEIPTEDRNSYQPLPGAPDTDRLVQFYGSAGFKLTGHGRDMQR